MIKVTVLYPNTPESRFDLDYYCNTHMPLVRDKLGLACKGIAVDAGIAGEGGNAPFSAMCHLFFDSVEAFEAAFGPHEAAIMADIPNYTNVAPLVQISRVTINATRGNTGELHLHRAE
ncbi:MAG TPA: EthD family reductase [Rhodocyclaceae bacterium]|jgi:uncharacterized protein (TIGR02118 family)|nr:EthD family reductase [Rhodocyclaceae bacterium]HMV20102.1 EthD family reductase [Rhodocyclaceae bacterium]HMW77741.1 EthD family reductase [Rhodocyclaceae bacterium]HNE42026.1 EthD family reductase [Rhodocyclaceae bacterium]HNM21094.1 EthD family reductase [Rhodocyclaceae bacterium]